MEWEIIKTYSDGYDKYSSPIFDGYYVMTYPDGHCWDENQLIEERNITLKEYHNIKDIYEISSIKINMFLDAYNYPYYQNISGREEIMQGFYSINSDAYGIIQGVKELDNE